MSEALSARFGELAQEWDAHRESRRESSNPSAHLDHPAFEAIVAMGEPAVPLIIERYRRGTVFWGAALRRITGKTEFGDGLVGDLEATRRAWLGWWDQQHGARAS